MKGICLKLYTYEMSKHHGIVLYQWILDTAKKQNIHGGFATRAITGYGHHGITHGEHFFELGSNVPVEITFLISKEEAQKLLLRLKQETISLFYSIVEAEFGFLTETT